MRFPRHLLQASTFRSEPAMAAMAAVAIGMFIGAWLIGPAITHGSVDTPPAVASQDKMTSDAMVARPDPPPYRAPTPAFDLSGPPNYAAVAKQKAQAELGGQVGDQAADDEGVPAAPSFNRQPSRYYRAFDRHKTY